MSDRIVVVGHAATTCLGRDLEATWRGLVAGRSGLRRHPVLRPEVYLQDIAGRVEDFDPSELGDDPAVARISARWIHLALAAARRAWADAGLEAGRFHRDRVAVVVGTALSGLDLVHHELEALARRGGLTTDQYLVPSMIANQGVALIAQQLGLHGPSVAPVNACATGGHALVMAAMFLRAGMADLAVCGAGESVFHPVFINGLVTMRAMAPRQADDRAADDPSQASRPFSVDRSGMVLAEGAGMLVLATETAALRLGMRVQAELAGWAVNTDGYHMARPDGARIALCLAGALEHAGLRPDQVDYYNAHGTSTPTNDRVETQAIKEVFGPHARRLPISSIKGALGHSLGAASAIEAAVCVRALREQVIPPTINYRPDPELDLDYVPNQARARDPLDTILSASFGFGGTNNALIFRRWIHG